MAANPPDWTTCAECGGARVQGTHCLAHLTESEFSAEIAWLRAGGALDARGVALSAERLRALVDQLRPTKDSRPQFAGVADFSGAQFAGDVSFHRAQFYGEARFGGAQFAGVADFSGAQVAGVAYFGGAQFGDGVLFGGAQFAGVARFDGAQFAGFADFSVAQFAAVAYFGGAQFARDARFVQAQFSDVAVFGRGVVFAGGTVFGEFTDAFVFGEPLFFGVAMLDRMSGRGARFSGDADFRQTRFSGDAVFFNGAQFARDARFGEAQFSIFADLSGVRFSGDAVFNEAQFAGDAVFNEVQFSSVTGFAGAWFGGGAAFAGSAFERRVTIGPLVVSGALVFNDAEFQQDVELNASSGELLCLRTRFGGRADLNVRWAEVALDNATFMARSRLAGAAKFASNPDETSAQLCRADRKLDANARPRLVSLRHANVENLAIGNIDLRACRFLGAHGLDELRVEADCKFAQPPPKWRYTRRRTLAEEHHWQAERAASTAGAARPSEWYPGACQPPPWLEPAAEVLDPARIAALYRALRKALEDRKDEPGAGDFYYGEMQMRRYAARSPRSEREADQADEPEADQADEPSRPSARGERWLLTLYWLMSGYALRASRAFASLVLVILLFALGFWACGFADPGVQTRVRAVSPRGALVYERVPAQDSTATEVLDAVIYSAGTATSVIGAPERKLSSPGNVLRIMLRVLGPILIGLTLLSIRGRVKR